VTLPATHSLRARLLWLLLAAILLGTATQGLFAYRTALAEADEIFDYHMQQMALSLRSGLPVNGADVRGEDAQDASSDEFIVQIWTSDGLRVYQSGGRSALPQRAVLGFSEVQARGTRYRVLSVQTRGQVVQVAQDMAVRHQMARTLALRTVVPTVLMAPLLMLIVWWVVTRSLAPVSRVRRQLAQRQSADLDPVSEDDLPDEIRPLVRELNALFGRVREAFEAQKSFVADAAHELRSPLAALKLQVQGLRRAGDQEARERAAGRLEAGIDRASRLVEQLLVLARHQASATPGTPAQPHVLAALARQAVADASASAHARSIDLGLAPSDEAAIACHPDAIEMLLRNLLDNAIKYTPPGGTVTVQVRAEARSLLLSVDDSGPGIPPEDRARVLDRFYRVPGSDATGSGLGLSIVKAVADLHGASLVLVSSPELGGLRVELRFAQAA
jgi:two-component system OmpR family sensor kinase